jgi:hypothetical protein
MATIRTNTNPSTARSPGILILLAMTACARVETEQVGATPQPGPASSNAAPLISGQPMLSVIAGDSYVFRPAASDSNGDLLSFGIVNKPAWASFSPATGQLDGTPSNTATGTYTDIVIHVSDGRSSTSLTAFTLVVAPAGNDRAILRWAPPTHYTNGTPLTSLTGYWIYYGTSATSLNRTWRVTDPLVTQHVVSGLALGTHYFSMTAYDLAGIESDLSTIGIKTVE